MKRPDYDKYRQILMSLKMSIMNGGLLTSSEDMAIATEDLPDEADLATNVINQQVTFNIKQRELGKLKAIEEALMRMKEGSYGTCEECGEAISAKRLENRPWATLCITHAEEREREEQKFTKAS